MHSTINGKKILLNPEILDRKLLDFLREELDLTGAKNGCGTGACGACTILVDQQPLRACTRKVKHIEGKEVLTIEGFYGPEGGLYPLQQAFIDCGAIQCGFCTPAMVLTAHALLLSKPEPSRQEIREALSPVLCRCTGYMQIVDAVESAIPFYKK